MKEDFLHYLWKYQLFTKVCLETTANESLDIISVGIHNHNAGPDFFNAKIRIANQLWVGNVEIHLKASDWYVHHHEKDANFDAVILHVVLEDDVAVFNRSNVRITTLILKDSIPKSIYNNYKRLFGRKRHWIPCQNSIKKVDAFVFENWMERLFFERLTSKAQFISDLLEKTANDWEAVLFYLLAKNFGLKINAEAFLSFAQSLDFNCVRKERFDFDNLEALFFGQAGLLENEGENPYYKNLIKRYAYLKHKYQLEKVHTSVQFFRLRPANFPTIRISQFARLYHEQRLLFSEVIKVKTKKECYDLLDVSTSEFWDTHFTFDKVSKKRSKKVSKTMIDLILINTVIPLQFVYQKSIGKLEIQQLISLQQQVDSEKNTIITNFETIGLKVKNAYESQALLQLKNNYCDPKHCLQCAVGSFLLQHNK